MHAYSYIVVQQATCICRHFYVAAIISYQHIQVAVGPV